MYGFVGIRSFGIMHEILKAYACDVNLGERHSGVCLWFFYLLGYYVLRMDLVGITVTIKLDYEL